MTSKNDGTYAFMIGCISLGFLMIILSVGTSPNPIETIVTTLIAFKMLVTHPSDFFTIMNALPDTVGNIIAVYLAIMGLAIFLALNERLDELIEKNKNPVTYSDPFEPPQVIKVAPPEEKTELTFDELQRKIRARERQRRDRIRTAKEYVDARTRHFEDLDNP